jgi:hypothetical protein
VELLLRSCHYSTPSFAAAVVRHCMLPGASAPPLFSGTTWSITKALHAPVVLPVDGQACALRNAEVSVPLRAMRPLVSQAQEAHLERGWTRRVRGHKN